jgi:hypothetical protein
LRNGLLKHLETKLTILRKIAEKLTEADKKLQPWTEEAEIKLFFLFRHYTPLPFEVNKLVFDRWEPRTNNLIKKIGAESEAYARLRKFLGIEKVTPGPVVTKAPDFVTDHLENYYNKKDKENDSSFTWATEDRARDDYDDGCSCGCGGDEQG